MMVLPPDFKDLLRLLNENGVDYLVIGGYAVGFHGYPRATIDLDLWVSRTRENASRIVTALKTFGFDLPGLEPGLFLDERKVIRLGNPPLRVEIMTTISGGEFSRCFARRVVAELDGCPVGIISLEDLKTNKKAAGRLKDLADLEELP